MPLIKEHHAGFTVWFTGLPGSGKSTLSKMLGEKLKQFDLPVNILDGDQVRKRLTKGLGFSREDREENIRRIAYVAKLLTNIGGITIVAAISPYLNSRAEARAEIKDFIEVFVKCPLQTCIHRDPKGMYAKATRGEITNFTGISDPYEPPEKPEIIVRTDQENPEESLRRVLIELVNLGYISNKIISYG
jgi:adenylyl-sulfate kinase